MAYSERKGKDKRLLIFILSSIFLAASIAIIALSIVNEWSFLEIIGAIGIALALIGVVDMFVRFVGGYYVRNLYLHALSSEA